ncbi:MAG: hypothetical protein NTZ78_12320 [Candidatus Aureabacteria bacterium]|nr:hypothetical protein [Candidatus Auribacterota bacterium]
MRIQCTYKGRRGSISLLSKGVFICGICVCALTTFAYGKSLDYHNAAQMTDENGDILPLEDLIQLIKDGGDNVISPPDGNGNPTGDDLLADTTTISDAAGGAGYFYDIKIAVSEGEKYYVRSWNASTASSATYYGDDDSLYTVPSGAIVYYDCGVFSTSNPKPGGTPATPTETPAETPTVTLTPTDTPTSAPTTTPTVTPTATITPLAKSADVDGDGNLEFALDKDHRLANGYEFYLDPDRLSNAVLSVDGDGDHTIEHFIDTHGDVIIYPNGDLIPEVYWDPDNGCIAAIALKDISGDGTPDWSYDSNCDGVADRYYDPKSDVIRDIVAATPTPTETPTPSATPTLVNFIELHVTGRTYHGNELLKLTWDVDPDKRFNLMERPLAIYFAAAEGSSVSDRPSTVSEISSAKTLYLFTRTLATRLYSSRTAKPAWTGAIFPLGGTQTSGSFTLSVPSGLAGTRWVFAAAFVDQTTGQFINSSFPVEISNSATME